ncbi:hypothetical protein JR316_0008797 [Psilocybe cubensis]|uniref:Novel STAND NTPase 1 domain-containing protein n=2 Tax=Psilocybe cubensis TaxID=181762 RepID=A0A8H8CKF5_PSICU|nr:hypothetical protein JR316_0008797 [Psilocybe cubensis]KAH9478343.1 hypothetical protein JR316_0008797 [Psilocybe cubensis]
MPEQSKPSTPTSFQPNAGSIANFFRPNRAAPNIGNALVLSSFTGLAPVDSQSIARLTSALESSSDATGMGLGQVMLALRILSSVGDGMAPFPALKGIAGIGLEIMNVIVNFQSNGDAMRALALRIYEMIRTINEGSQNGSNESLRTLTDQFERDLCKILNIVKDMASQNIGHQVIRAEVIKAKLIDCTKLLDQYTDKFQVALGINQQQILVRQQENLSRQQESVDKIVAMLEKHTLSTPVNNLLISAIAPAPPMHFVGRDDLVLEGISHITDANLTSSAHIAILGHGGIGKTSLALAILHHDMSKAAFSGRRFFIPCEYLKTGLDLAQAIIHILGGSMLGQESDGLTVLRQQLSNFGEMLLVIDNFETLWHESTSLAQIKVALETIMSVSSVSVIVTMRGFEPPSGFNWSLILPPQGLGPLSLDAAKHMYMRGQYMVPESFEWNRDLELLLTETDCVPLAISLLSALAHSDPRVYTPTRLLQRWTKTKTNLLKIPGVQSNKMASVAISIDVSLHSKAIAENPDTLILLQILAFLPEGLPYWDELVEYIIPDTRIEDPFGTVEILCQTSLIFKADNNSLALLSPTRHYINQQSLVEKSQFNNDIQQIYNFVQLCIANGMENLIKFGVANITQVIEHFLVLHPTTENVQTALHCSEVLFQHAQYMSNLMNTITNMAEKLNIPQLLVKCVVHQRDILMALNMWMDAEQKSQLGYILYQKLGDNAGMAECLHNIGHNMKMQSKYSEAIEMHTLAYEIYIKLGKLKQTANSLKAIGNNLWVLHKHEQAIEKLTEALTIYTQLKDLNGMGHCMKGIGNNLRAEKNYSEAIKMHTAAYNYYYQKKNKEGMAGALNCLGDDFRMIQEYEKAAEKHTEAYNIFKEINNTLGLAASLDSHGDTLRLQGDYAKAAIKHEEAYKIFVKYQYWHGIGNSLNSMGDNYKEQKKYPEAKEKYQAAYDIFKSLDNKSKMEKCDENLKEIAQYIYN